ncbi:uncharacterized protein LOC128338823 [Hemicordylus capensis]|uniref:uncharacterized protein LOC128338823 n=1 Tax=Hemicordylus capensis TaxID=884348 RepID=UPI002302717F|nr:uncharacterized protein LOC128338823 [Hemicordylus capensis]
MTRNMEATQELSSMQKVQLQQEYWVTGGSKAKLMQVGAKCMDSIIHREHYYDTASDELATAQLWLSQRNQQWGLIVGSQEQAAREYTASSVPKICTLPCQDRTENAQSVSPAVDQEKKRTQSESLDNQQFHHHALEKADEASACARSSPTYTELVGEQEIITHLADFLHMDLTSQGRNMTIEDFLQQAGIQHYASSQTVHQTTYALCNQYTIIIQRDESSLKESAIVLLDVDILSICKGFEEIEKLANYLEFEHQASST